MIVSVCLYCLCASGRCVPVCCHAVWRATRGDDVVPVGAVQSRPALDMRARVCVWLCARWRWLTHSPSLHLVPEWGALVYVCAIISGCYLFDCFFCCFVCCSHPIFLFFPSLWRVASLLCRFRLWLVSETRWHARAAPDGAERRRSVWYVRACYLDEAQSGTKHRDRVAHARPLTRVLCVSERNSEREWEC